MIALLLFLVVFVVIVTRFYNEEQLFFRKRNLDGLNFRFDYIRAPLNDLVLIYVVQLHWNGVTKRNHRVIGFFVVGLASAPLHCPSDASQRMLFHSAIPFQVKINRIRGEATVLAGFAVVGRNPSLRSFTDSVRFPPPESPRVTDSVKSSSFVRIRQASPPSIALPVTLGSLHGELQCPDST